MTAIYPPGVSKARLRHERDERHRITITPSHAPTEGGAIDPVCGMTVDPAGKHAGRLSGRDLLLLLQRLPHQIRRRPGEISAQAHEAAAGATRSGLRHDRRSRHRQAPRRVSRAHLLFLLPPAAAPSSSPIRRNISSRANAEPVLEGAIYTCPMHPEIRQVGPGSCPICGMALEPEIATPTPARTPSSPT